MDLIERHPVVINNTNQQWSTNLFVKIDIVCVCFDKVK